MLKNKLVNLFEETKEMSSFSQFRISVRYWLKVLKRNCKHSILTGIIIRLSNTIITYIPKTKPFNDLDILKVVERKLRVKETELTNIFLAVKFYFYIISKLLKNSKL